MLWGWMGLYENAGSGMRLSASLLFWGCSGATCLFVCMTMLCDETVSFTPHLWLVCMTMLFGAFVSFTPHLWLVCMTMLFGAFVSFTPHLWLVCVTMLLFGAFVGFTPHLWPIGTTRPIPPNRRSCLGCIRWKDMSNPKHLR